MVDITLPVVMCWLMAIWWSVLGYRDFHTIEYHSHNKRYRKVVPFFLATLASMDATLMGYFLAYRQRTVVNVLTVLMAVLLVLWIMAARQYRRHQ